MFQTVQKTKTVFCRHLIAPSNNRGNLPSVITWHTDQPVDACVCFFTANQQKLLNSHLTLTAWDVAVTLTLTAHSNTAAPCAAVSTPGSRGREARAVLGMICSSTMLALLAPFYLRFQKRLQCSGPQTTPDTALHWNYWRDRQCEHFWVLQHTWRMH